MYIYYYTYKTETFDKPGDPTKGEEEGGGREEGRLNFCSASAVVRRGGQPHERSATLVDNKRQRLFESGVRTGVQHSHASQWHLHVVGKCEVDTDRYTRRYVAPMAQCF